MESTGIAEGLIVGVGGSESRSEGKVETTTIIRISMGTAKQGREGKHFKIE